MLIKYSILISAIGLLGVLFVLLKKIIVSRSGGTNIANSDKAVDNSFILNILVISADRAVYLLDFSVDYFCKEIRPSIDRTIDKWAFLMHSASAQIAKKFIQFSNFIQGKRVLRKRGNTSLFLRDMSNLESGERGVESGR